MLAVAACAVPKNVAAPDDDPPPVRISQIEGVVVDRATGKPLPGAEIRFEDNWRFAYITDDSGGYSVTQGAGSTRTAVIISDDGGWMFEPFVAGADDVTKHDVAFAPDPSCARRDNVDVDRVFKVALVEGFGDAHPGARIVDDRERSRGNSVSMGGIDLTTRELLQEESYRSHKTIYFSEIDAKLQRGCTAHVTIGQNCVTPHEDPTNCHESRFWLYIKDASGWHRLASLGGAAS